MASRQLRFPTALGLACLAYQGAAREPEPSSEAEQALRAAIKAGNKHALTDLGDLLSKRAGEEGAERAYREALKAGDRRAWIGLGNLL